MLKRQRTLLILIAALFLSGISAAPAPPMTGALESLGSVDSQDDADQCLACHTDKDELVSTAKSEVAVESENEGEG